jgi:hypothetical protein
MDPDWESGFGGKKKKKMFIVHTLQFENIGQLSLFTRGAGAALGQAG